MQLITIMPSGQDSVGEEKLVSVRIPGVTSRGNHCHRLAFDVNRLNSCPASALDAVEDIDPDARRLESCCLPVR